MPAYKNAKSEINNITVTFSLLNFRVNEERDAPPFHYFEEKNLEILYVQTCTKQIV